MGAFSFSGFNYCLAKNKFVLVICTLVAGIDILQDVTNSCCLCGHLEHMGVQTTSGGFNEMWSFLLGSQTCLFGGLGVVATLLILLRGKCFTCLGIAQKLPSRRCNPLKTPSFLRGETRVGTGIWTPGFK